MGSDLPTNISRAMKPTEQQLIDTLRHVQLICDNAVNLGFRLKDPSAIALNLSLAIGRIDLSIIRVIGPRPKEEKVIDAAD